MSTKTKGIFVYLLIAFGWSWIFWALLTRVGLSVDDPLFQLAIIPGSFSPALAAFIVRKWITREGFSDAGLKLNLKKKWHYYISALLFPFLMVLIIVLLSISLGIVQSNFILENVSVLPMLGLTILSSHGFADWLVYLTYLLCVTLIETFFCWGEEFGWRGYLQIRMLNTKPLLAAVATGLIWATWHYPVMFGLHLFNGHNILAFIVFCGTAVQLSIIFGWLKYRTDSIWTVSLAHSAINIGSSLAGALFQGIAGPILVGCLGVLGWIPLGALCVWIIIRDKFKLRP